MFFLKKKVPANWLACDWSLRRFRDRKKSGRVLSRAHPHVIRCFLFRLNYRLVPPRHCVSRGVTRDAFFERMNPVWNLMRPVSPCLDTWAMQSVAGRLRRITGYAAHGSRNGTLSLSIINHMETLFFCMHRSTTSSSHNKPSDSTIPTASL